MRHQQSIEQSMRQRLVVTPQLRQAIEILQLGAVELTQYLQEQITQNPLLEVLDDVEPADEQDGLEVAVQEEPGEAADGPADQLEEWLDYFADSSDLGLAPAPPPRQGPAPIEMVAAPGMSLAEHLRLQLVTLVPAPEPGLAAAAAAIIAALDDDGYLRLDLVELSRRTAHDAELVAAGLELVQRMEPTGIAARDLVESLLLQLKAMCPCPELAARLVREHLGEIAAGSAGRLAAATGATRREVEAAIELVRTLEPRPGAAFAGSGAPRYIVPDLVIELVDGEFLVTLNEPATPQLRINPYYRRLAAGAGLADPTAAEFLAKRLDSALWVLRCLEQRRTTLFRVAQAISRMQRGFLRGGIRYLQPMTLKDIAGEVGVHESTVSRAIANKYVETPQGAFELRALFTSSVGSSFGAGEVSSASVKNVLSQLVGAEDSKQPYSDQRLVELLDRRGARVSRRTVTKYRRELGIPSSTERRRP